MSQRSPEVIKSRIQTLTTVVERILCDYNNGVAQQSTTPTISYYKPDGFFQHRVLWK